MLGKAALVILLATILGRLVGLVRDQSIAYFFGMAGDTDAFFLANKIPLLLSLTIAGALTATFIPVFTQRMVTGREQEAWTLTASMTNAVALVLALISALLVLTAPWVIPLFGFGFPQPVADQAVILFRILMGGVIFTGLAGLATGVLNSLKSFALPAFSTSLGAVVTLVFILLFARSWGITSVAVGTTAGALAALAVLLPQLRRRGLRYSFRLDRRNPGMREVGMLIWPILLGSAVGKISIFVDQTLASTLAEGSVSALNYAEKLFQLPLGLFVAGITVPIFPLLSEHVAANQPERLKATLNYGLRLIAFIMLPATVGLIVLRTSIIGLLFEHGAFTAKDTLVTSWPLLFYALGLFSYAGRDTLTRVFYAYHDTQTPVKISVVAVVLNISVSIPLMLAIGVGGLALGTTIAMTVNMLVLMQLLRKKIGPMGLGALLKSGVGILGVSGVMGLVVWGVDTVLAGVVAPGNPGLAVRVAVGVGGGALVYFLAAKVARLRELEEIADVVLSIIRGRREGRRGEL
jgi:putative peptidoglycan lipid II flippase